MLAYTAVDGLRVISRDFDLDWQPSMNDDLAVARHGWRSSLPRGHGRRGQIVGALVALLPFGAATWLR